jgi:hypothetical protein
VNGQQTLPGIERSRYELARVADAYAAVYAERSALTVQEWFMLAWAREVPDLAPIPNNSLPTLNLGAGRRQIGKSEPLDLEHGWDAEEYGIPYEDGSVAGIWAHGFFEHVSPARVPYVLHECQRVLCYRGVLNIVVPHAMAEMYPEDITHKSMWHEATINNIMNNPYYEHGDEDQWELTQHTCFIMGVVWRNLGIFYQLVKYAP